MYRAKKSIIAIVLLVLVLAIPNAVFGKKNIKEEKIRNITVEGMIASVYNDGRVKGINNPESLNEKQKKELLKLMRFTDEEINEFPDELKNDFLHKGGLKVEVEIEDLEHVYTDLDGVDHVVTAENKKEIEEIKKRDFARINVTKNKSENEVSRIQDVEFPEFNDDKFTMKGFLTYNGLTSNQQEYKYTYRTYWQWEGRPIFYFVDTVAQAWQNHTISTESSASYMVRRGSDPNFSYFSYGHDGLDFSSLYGTKATINIRNDSGKHYGSLTDEIRIPITHDGETGQWVSGYAHAWTGFNIGVTFKAVTINYNSKPGDKWTWKNTFEYIGDSNPTPID